MASFKVNKTNSKVAVWLGPRLPSIQLPVQLKYWPCDSFWVESTRPLGKGKLTTTSEAVLALLLLICKVKVRLVKISKFELSTLRFNAKSTCAKVDDTLRSGKNSINNILNKEKVRFFDIVMRY